MPAPRTPSATTWAVPDVMRVAQVVRTLASRRFLLVPRSLTSAVKVPLSSGASVVSVTSRVWPVLDDDVADIQVVPVEVEHEVTRHHQFGVHFGQVAR